MTLRQGKRLIDKHAELLEEFQVIQSAQFYIRQECIADRRFVSIPGAQWEGDLLSNWPDNKPRFEVNKIQRSLNRIDSEYRNQRIDGGFISKDGKDADELADACASIYRGDMQDSVADEARDNAFGEAIAGGIGAWRLKTVMEDEDDEENENQRIAWEPIVDADTSVYFDLDCKRQDKADARLCFVLYAISRSSFERKYPEDSPTTWPKAAGQAFFDWCSPDVVYLAEAYQVEKKGYNKHIFGLDATEEEQELSDEDLLDQDLMDELQAKGWHELRVEKSKRKRVRKYLMSGGRILEDDGFIVGPNIPIVVVYGKRWFIDNAERFQGQVRLAKDAQRLANMERSKMAEIAAYSTIEKPIMTPDQVIGHSDKWSEDNVKNYPYLLVNKVLNPDGTIAAIGPASYTRVPQIPPALAALLQIVEKDLQDLTAEQDSAQEVHSNVSGKAIELTQNRLDMQAYLYISNMAKAVHREVEIWYGMAPEVYADDGRKVKGVDLKGEAQALTLNDPAAMNDGTVGYNNNIRDSKMDVTVTVGPSSQSKRDATVRTLTSLMSVIQIPEDQQVLSALLLQNIEGEGIEAINKYYHGKLVKMGVEKPTDDEKEELAAEAQADANKPPDPNSVYLLAGAQKQAADAQLSIAKIEQTKADAAKTVSDIEASDLQGKLSVLAAVDATLQAEASVAANPGLQQPQQVPQPTIQ